MSYEVSIVKCDSYDEAEVRKAIEASLAPIGGPGSAVKKSDRVLIKLNLLSSAPPEAAVTTHPSIVKAVVRMVQELGAIPVLGDSPGGGSSVNSYRALLEKTGIKKVVEETGCELVRFDDAEVQVSSGKARTFKQLKIARAVTDADVIIGLPKMKTHGLTLFTGAVKLNFGYVPGMTKMEYHLHTARDVGLFAEFLLDLHEAYRPSLSIMDAIVGMEGNGPRNGDPRKIGLILSSKSCTALDYVASAIAGFDPLSVPTVKRAYERNIGPKSLNEITVFGEKVEPLVLKDFKKPTTSGVSFRGSAFLAKSMKNLMAYKPRINASKCKKCGECAKDCPPRAIKFTKGSVPSIDHNRCIRCYCCQELCPSNAVYVTTPLLRRIIRR
jgi:uncharacterized protein (DUF362 family)/NAD-dependent dihydropyrimidine dehydrogenase PreA subunit